MRGPSAVNLTTFMHAAAAAHAAMQRSFTMGPRRSHVLTRSCGAGGTSSGLSEAMSASSPETRNLSSSFRDGDEGFGGEESSSGESSGASEASSSS